MATKKTTDGRVLRKCLAEAGYTWWGSPRVFIHTRKRSGHKRLKVYAARGIHDSTLSQQLILESLMKDRFRDRYLKAYYIKAPTGVSLCIVLDKEQA